MTSRIAVYTKSAFFGLGLGAAWLATPAYADSSEAEAQHAKKKHVAQAEATKRAKKRKKKVEGDTAAAATKAEAATAERESSTHARDTKPLSLYVDTGLVNLINTGIGAELNYAVTPHEVLGLSVLHAQFALFDFKSTYDFYTVNSRTFFGNSFYLLLGGGLRTIDYASTYYADASANGASTTTTIVGTKGTNEFTAMDIVGEVGIGNRWQFGSGITLGCDWIAYDQPIAQLSSTSRYGTQAQSQQQKDDDLNKFRQASESGSLTITRFHIGWAF